MNRKIYLSAKDYFNINFGKKFRKLSIDAGFSCPGRCIYCSTSGSLAINSAEVVKSKFEKEDIDYLNRYNFRFSLKKRFEIIKEQIDNFLIKNKEFQSSNERKSLLYLYLQAFSNTYDTPENLKIIYDYCLSLAEFDGVFIGTRPDCIDEEKAKILASYLNKYDLWVELGLQSSHDKTLRYINRKHGKKEFECAIKILRSHGIKIIAHVIIGLYDEDLKDLIQTVKFISNTEINGVKFHNLYILPNTEILRYYEKGIQKVLTSDQYIEQLIEAIQYLRDDIIIFRLFSDPEEGYIAPKWEKNKTELINDFNKLCEKKQIWQGKLWQKN